MAPVMKAKSRMVWIPTQRKKTESPPVHREPISKQCSFGVAADADEDPARETAGLQEQAFKPPCRVTRMDTNSSDSTESGNASFCGSLDSSSEDCCDLALPIYSADLLLRLRGGLLRARQLPEVAPSGWTIYTEPRPVEEPETPEFRKPRLLDSPTAGGGMCKERADQGQSKLPPASPNSWAEAQRLRRQKEDSKPSATIEAQEPVGPSDAEMTRRIKSILNKLTPEKFATLYEKLTQCGITELTHVEILARLVFEEAAMQHTFSGMYAELCMYMVHDLGEYGAGAVLQEHLYAQCMQLLECTLDQALACASPRHLEDEEEAKVMQKRRLIGGTRFAGELIIRGVFPGELLFTFTEWLAQRPIDAFNLERLVALLNVVGPVLDHEMWPLYENLVPVFWTVHGLTFDAEVPKRVRCLLRDVVELRETGWAAAGGKSQERPMTLDEVRMAAGQVLQPPAGGKPEKAGKKGKKKNKDKEQMAGPPMTLDLASMTAGDYCADNSYSAWEYCDPSEMYQGFDLEGMQGMQYHYDDAYGYGQQPCFEQQQGFEAGDFDQAGFEQLPPCFEGEAGSDQQQEPGLAEGIIEGEPGVQPCPSA